MLGTVLVGADGTRIGLALAHARRRGKIVGLTNLSDPQGREVFFVEHLVDDAQTSYELGLTYKCSVLRGSFDRTGKKRWVVGLPPLTTCTAVGIRKMVRGAQRSCPIERRPPTC